MNDLAQRKRLLTAQADLHRELMGLECARWHGRWSAAGSFTRNNRWWLAGGVLVAGVLLTRRWRGLVQWLPAAASLWRVLKG